MRTRARKTPDVHLNLNVRGLKPSPTLAINERCSQLSREGRRIFKLGLGQSPFPVPTEVVEQLQANAFQKDYLPVKGLPQLREAVAAYNRGWQGLASSAQDILIGPGSKELMFILMLTYYGDLVIPTPSWVTYAPQGHIIGRQVHWLTTDAKNHWRLMPEELERLCCDDPDRPRLVVFNYPSNPTGGTYRRDDLKAIAAVARRYRVLLLSDEIYGELHHQGRHVSIGRYYPEGTIVSSGLSKWCGAGGWRLGTFSFPASLHWLLDAMAAVASETYTATSAPIQYAAVRAFQKGTEIEHYLTCSRRLLGALGRHVAKSLRTARIEVQPPQGGFYLFPDMGQHADALKARGITTSEALCETLLQDTGVAILPGSAFGRPADELTARLAYVDFDGARVLAALPDHGPLGEEFLHTYCGNVMEAVDRLVSWLER